MRAPVHLRLLLAISVVFPAACGGSGPDPAASEGAGRAVPTEIADLQADCDRGAPGSCEALNGRVDDGLSTEDRERLLCAAWGEIQLVQADVGADVDRIIALSGDDLPPRVVTALRDMAIGSDDDVDQARDVVDDHFLDRC